MQSNRSAIAWALYDWGVFSFTTIVLTFIFAAYFTSRVPADHILRTEQWGYAVAIASLIVVILSPIFGAIADYCGPRKPWLFVFTLLTIVGAGLLWYAYPNANAVYTTLGALIIGIIGYEISQVFYNALLPNVASAQNIGRVSGWGWGMGDAGGVMALIISLVWFVQGKPAWLNQANAEYVRICGMFAAVWIAVFAIPLFMYVPDYPLTQRLSIRHAIAKGFDNLRMTLREWSNERNLFRFLIARMIYIDGLNTVISFGGIYAAGTFSMSLAQVIEFGISLNIIIGLGAISCGWFDDKFGSKKTVFSSLIGMMIVGVPILFVHSITVFWLLSLILCFFIGPIQAASRSLMVRIAPRENLTQFFGLYTFSGKATAFLGPWMFALLTGLFNTQRAGMSCVLLFFMVGAWLLWSVKEIPHHANA